MATYVGAANGSSDSSGTSTATGAFTLTAGNHVYVWFSREAADGSPTIADTAGNTYTLIENVASSNGDQWISHWYCANAAGNASNVVTVSHASAAYRAVSARQYSGGAFTYINKQSNDTAGSASITTTAISAAGAGLTIAACKAYNSGTWSAGANMANVATPTGGSGIASGSDRIFGSSGSYGTESAFSANTQLTTVAALFEDAGGGGGATLKGRRTLLGAGL
jgi:hypothetical protein